MKSSPPSKSFLNDVLVFRPNFELSIKNLEAESIINYWLLLIYY